MSDTAIKLVPGRANRGKFPIILMRGDEVLVTGQVNPHKADEIEAFVERVCTKLPGAEGQADELRAALLQLAAPKLAAGPRPPRSPDEHPYSENRGSVYLLRSVGETEVVLPLMNFTARVVADVIRDDGAERETAFAIEANLGGQKQTFTITAARFNSMTWPLEHLGAQAIVYPGQSNRDHARAAIQFLSPKPIPRQTIYTHTGWRKLEGENGGWVYLHGGGAIGAYGRVDGVRVELPSALAHYNLPDPPQGNEMAKAIRAALGLFDLAADEIAFPAFCAVWRAALGQCDFGLHLAGPTGVFKSELAALVQQFFGAGLDARHLPGSWHSTDNAIEGLLFAAKDAVTVVDDFAPCGGPHDIARWHQRADRIIRAQGNNAGRGRMRADGTLRPPKPPRGLVLSTGEDIPKGQSLRARMLILEISRGDIAVDVLSRCQQDARSGLYVTVMAGFVRNLAGRYEPVSRSFRDDIDSLRQRAADSTVHCRTPEIVANLALGLRYFIEFAKEAGAMTEADADELWQRGWVALGRAAERQTAHQANAEPAQRFIDLIQSAIASGNAHLAEPDGTEPEKPAAWGWRQKTIGIGAYATEEWQPQGDRVGWVDGEEVLLDPDASFKAAQSMAGTNGDGLAITPVTLRKRLVEQGMAIRLPNRDELLVRRVLEGRTRNVLLLARGVLSAQSTIPTFSTDFRESEHEKGKGMANSMGGNGSLSDAIRHNNPPLGPPPGTENSADGANGGNGGKRSEDTCARKSVIEI